MLPKSLIMNPGLILYYCVVVVVKFGFGRLGGMGGWLVSASKVTHVIGFRAKGVSPDILQFTKHQQPYHHRRHVSQLCCVLNNYILSSLIDGQSPACKHPHPARQDMRVRHDPSSSALLLAALRLPLMPRSSKPLSTPPVSLLESGVSRQYLPPSWSNVLRNILRGSQLCYIAEGLNFSLTRYPFVPIQSNQ